MSPSDDKILAWRVVGRVQGVGFRYWTRQQAQRLALSGTVRNAVDGSVIVVAKGPFHSLEQLRALLESGPPGSNVSSVEPLSPPDEDLPILFEIRR